MVIPTSLEGEDRLPIHGRPPFLTERKAKVMTTSAFALERGEDLTTHGGVVTRKVGWKAKPSDPGRILEQNCGLEDENRGLQGGA